MNVKHQLAIVVWPWQYRPWQYHNHVLRDAGEFAGGQVREVRSSNSLSVIGIALTKNGRTRLMVANLDHRSQAIRIQGLARGKAEWFQLDGGNVSFARSVPEEFSGRPGQALTVTQEEVEIHLAPHAIARIDQPGYRDSAGPWRKACHPPAKPARKYLFCNIGSVPGRLSLLEPSPEYRL